MTCHRPSSAVLQFGAAPEDFKAQAESVVAQSFSSLPMSPKRLVRPGSRER